MLRDLWSLLRKDLYKQIKDSFNDDKEKFAKIVYDMVLMYDLWFVENDKENLNR